MFSIRCTRRARFDIMADILKASVGGARKTQLMYQCNLSFQQLKKYLSILMQKGLLKSVFAKKETPTNLFKTTEKGRNFLRRYRNMITFLTV